MSIFHLLSLVSFLTIVLGQSASRLRVEYMETPLTIDTLSPKFSWALVHSQRGQSQTAYQIIVTNSQDTTKVLWNSSKVISNRTLNIPYEGLQLVSDSDYSWSITWWDNKNVMSDVTSSTFSTAILDSISWYGAQWISSPLNGSLNTYRAEFLITNPILRARLYISGLGYHKAWLNGYQTDSHELGTFTTFQKRILYSVIDITLYTQQGCNALGIMLGNGWFSQPSVNVGPKQFIALLSITTSDGLTTYYPSTLGTEKTSNTMTLSPLVFTATTGPVLSDDIYLGEVFDGRIASAINGWTKCNFTASNEWIKTITPLPSPFSFNAFMESRKLEITNDEDFIVKEILSPSLNEYTFDFGQNMAGQITLTVSNCPAGTSITMSQAEMIFSNGSINNIYTNSPMKATYICSGTSDIESYRTLFTYFGFRYTQLLNYPGIPDETSLVAHYIHSDIPKTGEFLSSNTLLNAIQHATRYSLGSNMMDVPTDCPQRERRGWLCDAAIVTETSILNFDTAVFHSKWMKDFFDAQQLSNTTMGGDGAIPECVPYYDHGHVESDAGWGYAAWQIPTLIASYYDDSEFEKYYYTSTMKWYMLHWIKIAEAHGGILPIAYYGDWMEYYPGPWNSLSIDYAQFFYIRALDITTEWAIRLGLTNDAQLFANISQSARSLYLNMYYNASSNCFTDCHYVSQIFALTLQLFPQGSIEEAAIWANAARWWSNTSQFPEHFGGGVISLSLLYPLLSRFNATDVGLRFQLQTTRPSLGQMITDGATTLWEGLDQSGTDGPGSKNHAFFGTSGYWYYTGLAGLVRVPGSRSWKFLEFAPPTFTSGIIDDLDSALASIDTPMGRISSSWRASSNSGGTVCGTIYEEGQLSLSCNGGGLFEDVAFASFGTPIGDCNSGLVRNLTCDSANSMSAIQSTCLGKNSCTVWANSSVFGGDPCVGVRKSLAVALLGKKCTNAAQIAPLYSLDIELPPNSIANVKVPIPNSPSTSIIMEGNVTIWNKNGYSPGVAGIYNATAKSDVVVFSIGSGIYSFTVFNDE
jgi:alpha-L-rhamnosidase